MSALDLAEYAVMNLKHRSLRSWLTILGIVIGVFAIVTMVAVAEGLDQYVKAQLNFLSEDVISVVAGSVSMSTAGGMSAAARDITEDEFQELLNLPSIEAGGATMEGKARVRYRDQNISTYVIGADPILFTEMYDWPLDEGRWYKDNDRGVMVIGDGIAHDTFDRDVQLGQKIYVGDRGFVVIGIAKKGTGLMSAIDNMIYIPKKDARDVIPEFAGNKIVSEIHLKVVPGTNISEAEQEIVDEMLKLHHVTADKKDFTVMSSIYIAQQVGNITGALGLFLGGIAAISLFVGSIGIANTMFMSIMERTKEIGTMKAIGARDSDIMMIFLIESGIIGIVGGAIGLALSLGVSAALNQFGVPSSVKLEVMLGAVVFSLIVGMAAGYVPAKNASKLNAVEALRFE